jgi:hypothetical protein
MVPRVGLEPTTLGLEVLCSIQLSYQGTPLIITDGIIAKERLNARYAEEMPNDIGDCHCNTAA